MISLKKIITILRSDGVRVLQAEAPKTLCEVLIAALAFNRARPTSLSRRVPDRLDQPLPEGYNYRKQMWTHFKTCSKCMGNLRTLYRERKTLNINISTNTSDYDLKGKMMVEITVIPFTFTPNEKVECIPQGEE